MTQRERAIDAACLVMHEHPDLMPRYMMIAAIAAYEAVMNESQAAEAEEARLRK